jgi:hypothetical protein
MQKYAVFDSLKLILPNPSHSLAQPDASTHTMVFVVLIKVNKFNTNCNTTNSNGTLYKDTRIH